MLTVFSAGGFYPGFDPKPVEIGPLRRLSFGTDIPTPTTPRTWALVSPTSRAPIAVMTMPVFTRPLIALSSFREMQPRAVDPDGLCILER